MNTMSVSSSLFSSSFNKKSRARYQGRAITPAGNRLPPIGAAVEFGVRVALEDLPRGLFKILGGISLKSNEEQSAVYMEIRLAKNFLTPQQIKTLNGQVKAGSAEAARKGLNKILKGAINGNSYIKPRGTEAIRK